MKNYPKNPHQLPQNLTQLPSLYYLKASIAILSILLFFVLYGGLIYALGLLVYHAIQYPMVSINKITILGKLGAIAGSVMLFAFTLKFIFKIKNHKPENRIRLSKEKYPELWAFILKICEDTNAPKPKYIYADPDVNAYVRYTNTWLSLFLPVKKELTIGLGLVSTLNLSEFKAVMSHEFGHFAQRSMKIGSYIMSANMIIHGMIFDRDSWDNLLDQWRRSDIRLSIAAWVITPIVWLIRQVLNLFYQLLNIMYSSLSREMEFNADKVAVSTSGSEPIVSGLWKLEHGFSHWNSTLDHAYLASQKDLYAENLYEHMNFSISETEDELNTQYQSLPEHKLGGKQHFKTESQSHVSMYASHPPNNLREQNAKTPYVECEINTNTPWNLFASQTELQKEMTMLVYSFYLQKEPKNYMPFQDFRAFIKAEKQDSSVFEEYGNTFMNRFLTVPEEEELRLESIRFKNPTSSHFDTLKSEFETLNVPVKEIEDLLTKVVEMSEGKIKDKQIEYNGYVYKKKELRDAYQLMHTNREKLFSTTFKDWDIQFFALHYAIAKQQNSEQDLLQIYNQHRRIGTFYKAVLQCRQRIMEEVNRLENSEEVTDGDLVVLKSTVNSLFFDLNPVMNDLFIEETYIPLPNIDSIEELKNSIIDGGVFTKEIGDIFQNGGFNNLMQRLESTVSHCERIDRKSMYLILQEHSKLKDTILLESVS